MPQEFAQRVIFLPKYKVEKKEIQKLNTELLQNISKEGGGGGPLHQIEYDNDKRSLTLEEFIPIKDQNRIYEFNQIERRFKIQFNRPKMGYSNEYLYKLSDLLTQKHCKDYLSQRKQMMKKYQPISSIANNFKNNRGTFYLTDNQKTIQSQRAIHKKPTHKKFVYFPLTSRNNKHNKTKSCTIDTSNKEFRIALRDKRINKNYKDDDKDQDNVVELMHPIEDNIRHFDEYPERELIEKELKKKFNFFETNKSKTTICALKKGFNPGYMFTYYKNNNPSKGEYLNRVLITHKQLPSTLSHRLLPILQGFKRTRNPRKSLVSLF